MKLLSPKGGVILLLSDGLQTGATGNTPWPRAKWEPPAKALSEQARKNAVLTHTIALGPDAAADELLEHLWAHLNPRLEFRGLTRQDYTVRRGGSVALPVEVSGADLGEKKPGVFLEKAECPKGVRAGLAVRVGGKTLSVSRAGRGGWWSPRWRKPGVRSSSRSTPGTGRHSPT